MQDLSLPSTGNIRVKTLLVFLLIGVSTMPILKQSFGIYLLIGSVFFTLKGIRINKETFAFLFLALVLEIFHNFSFDSYDFATTRQTILLFAAGIFLIYYIKLDFFSIYIKILYWLSLISFVFVILYYADNGLLTTIVHAIPDTFIKTATTYGSESKQIDPIFYNFDQNFLELGRNNGPFWEPTVFATMLVIAQIFNLLLNKVLFNRKGIVFTIAILTTFSTTGFLAYFLLIIFYFLLSPRINILTKAIVAGGFLMLSVSLFTNLPFLSEKIDNEIEKSDYEIDQFGGDSRLASAILDMREVTEKNEYLLFGKGLVAESRIGGVDKEVLRNCGDTALLIEWGLLFTVIFIGLLFYSFLALTRFYDIHWGFSVIFTLIILIFGFSEVYFNLPFFYSLLFFGFIVRRYYPAKDHQAGFTKLAIG
jgi:hypothetical protein